MFVKVCLLLTFTSYFIFKSDFDCFQWTIIRCSTFVYVFTGHGFMKKEIKFSWTLVQIWSKDTCFLLLTFFKGTTSFLSPKWLIKSMTCFYGKKKCDFFLLFKDKTFVSFAKKAIEGCVCEISDKTSC